MGEMADYYASQAIDDLIEADLKRALGEFWTCKDGRRLRPREMTTEHLRNAIAMLQRRYHEIYGEPTFWSAEEAEDWHTSAPRPPKIEEWMPVIETMRGELELRGTDSPGGVK